MIDLVNAVNGIIWSPIMIALCLGAGLYFSVRSRFLQLRHVREMVRLVCACTRLTRNQAYMLCSLAGNLRITQTVDGNKGVHCMIEKKIIGG